jgi:hypothetical protein
MNIKEILSKLFFIIFNITTIIYFIKGYFYPLETNFWLIHWGFPIIMMEFFSIFVMFIVPAIKLKIETKTLTPLLIIVIFVGIISFLSNNYKIFLFFILTILSKFFIDYYSIDYENNMKLYVSVIVALIFSAILAAIFSGIGNNFPIQQDLLKNKFIETSTRYGGSIKGNIVENPAIIALWGLLYYLLLTIFQTFNMVKFQKPSKEPDSEELRKELRKK